MSTVDWIIVIVIAAAVFVLLQRWLKSVEWLISNFDYQCSHCGGYIYLTTWQAAAALHFNGRKWVRCPHCGQMTWAVPIRK